MELLCRFRRVRTLLHRQEVNNIIRYVPNATSVRKLHTARPSCVRKDVVPLYDGHIHTSPLQKGLLAIGSAMAALIDPTRDDMIANLGETTGHMALASMRDRMRQHAVGSEILHDRPRITAKGLDLPRLRLLPQGTLGRTYVDFMDMQGITTDSRRSVRFVDDEELAYVAQRYREIHDFAHCMLGFNTISEHDEIAVKWFEAVQTGLPMCYLSGIVGPMRLTPSEQMAVFSKYMPWARQCGRDATLLLNVYYEKRLDDNVDDLRAEMNITLPPTRS